MTTNRLYTFFSLITLLALMSAGILAIPMLVGSLNAPPKTAGDSAQVGGNASAVSAEQARLEFRRGEWNSGPAAVAASTDPEIQRFVAYANEQLAERARLAQRQGERNAGSAAVSTDPEIQRFVIYANDQLAARARLAQRQGEWHAGPAVGAAELDVEQARLPWRANK